MNAQPEKRHPICNNCGSTKLVWDAWASWDCEAQQLVLSADFDYIFCLNCETEPSVTWLEKPPE